MEPAFQEDVPVKRSGLELIPTCMDVHTYARRMIDNVHVHVYVLHAQQYNIHVCVRHEMTHNKINNLQLPHYKGIFATNKSTVFQNIMEVNV